MRLFLFVCKSIARAITRNTEDSEHSAKQTRKIKQTGLGSGFLLVVFNFILAFVRFSGKFQGVLACPGVPCFRTCHAKLPVSFSKTYLRPIMSLWKCLYTFVTDSVPNLKKEESYNKLYWGVFIVTKDYLIQRDQDQTREWVFDRYRNNHHKVLMKTDLEMTGSFIVWLGLVTLLLVRFRIALRQTANVTIKLRKYIMEKSSVQLLLLV